MSFIKEFFIQIKEMIDEFLNKITDNQIVKTLIKVVFLFIIFILIIALFASCSHKRYTYTEFEKEMVKIAKQKYKNIDLPKDDKGFTTISLQSFVDNKYIKNVSSIIQNKSVCTGNVKIINNNGNYLYIPTLDCGADYKTATLYENVVTNDNIKTTGNGLYKVNDEYIFKGDLVNNYISLNGIKYIILRVNSDGTLRVMDTTKREMIRWDDRYNVDKNTNYGINNYVYNGINSRIKDYVESVYNNTEIIKKDVKPYFVNTQSCIGKRSLNDNIFDTSIECSEKAEEFPFTLITANEYFQATLDTNCTNIESNSCSNYNYFNNIGSTWTITADKDTTYKAFKLNNGVYLSNASNTSYVKIVTTLNGELNLEQKWDSKTHKYVTGDGSEKNPYVIRIY